jgi:hypothetical protein
MSLKRRGQASMGMLVLVVFQGILVLGLGIWAAILSLKDKKDRADLEALRKNIAPFVEVRATSTTPELPPDDLHKNYIDKLVAQYTKAKEAKAADPKAAIDVSPVLRKLLVDQQAIVQRLTGKAELDPNEVLLDAARAVYQPVQNLNLAAGKQGAKEELIIAMAQIQHMTVPDLFKMARANYDLIAAELKTANARIAALDKAADWAEAAKKEKVNFEGAESNLDEIVKRKISKENPDAAEYIGVLVSVSKALSDKSNADAAAAKQNKEQLDKANTDFEAAKKDLNDKFEAAKKDFETKQAETVDALEAEKRQRTADVEKLTKNVNELTAVLNKRLQLYGQDIQSDLILESNGAITQVNKNKVLLSITNMARNKVVSGYRFSIYPADPKLPLTQEHRKAKVEVVSVVGSFAEANVVEGKWEGLAPGDRIANPFVGRRVRHVALVGLFDLDQDGNATQDETDQLRRRILSWGGIVDGELKETTDFIVVGFVPPDPGENPPPPTDPQVRQDQYKLARALFDAKKRADALSRAWLIPVLNQNRLFDLIGWEIKQNRR